MKLLPGPSELVPKQRANDSVAPPGIVDESKQVLRPRVSVNPENVTSVTAPSPRKPMSNSPSQLFDPALCVVAVQFPDAHVMLMSRLQGVCATTGNATSRATAQKRRERDMVNGPPK